MAIINQSNHSCDQEGESQLYKLNATIAVSKQKHSLPLQTIYYSVVFKQSDKDLRKDCMTDYYRANQMYGKKSYGKQRPMKKKRNQPKKRKRKNSQKV